MLTRATSVSTLRLVRCTSAASTSTRAAFVSTAATRASARASRSMLNTPSSFTLPSRSLRVWRTRVKLPSVVGLTSRDAVSSWVSTAARAAGWTLSRSLLTIFATAASMAFWPSHCALRPAWSATKRWASPSRSTSTSALAARPSAWPNLASSPAASRSASPKNSSQAPTQFFHCTASTARATERPPLAGATASAWTSTLSTGQAKRQVPGLMLASIASLRSRTWMSTARRRL